MSSWVAVWPFCAPPLELQYQRGYYGSKQRLTDHRRREEAGIPLRCRWAQSFPSTVIRAEPRFRAKPNQACHTRHQRLKSKRRQHIVGSTPPCSSPFTELVRRSSRSKIRPALPG